MAMTARIKLPWPPTINHYYGNRRNGGGKYIKPKGKAFRHNAYLCWLEAGRPYAEGRIAMRVQAYPPDHRKRDLDNILKAVQDALQAAGAYEDDCQIDLLTVERHPVMAGGRVAVTLEEIENEG